MKYLATVLLLALFCCSCKKQKAIIVDKAYVDSLISHYTLPTLVSDNQKDMEFWKKRIDPARPTQVNESRYASTLITRFHLFGDIQDVKQAESILKSVNKTYNNTLSSPFVSLAGIAMLQHRFTEADTLLQKAVKIGIDGSTLNTLSFDVNFELGRYMQAKPFLNRSKRANDYSYYFRRSKYDHLNGTVDSAINGMLKAYKLAEKSAYLQDVALSNAADLYIHAGDLEKAGDLYKQCINLNSADLHSIMGLGWIALVHDKNYALAQTIFKFAQTKTKLPDPLFKLYHTAQGKGDRALEKKYAADFVAKATDTVYGKMYNKYVIEIYAGVLNDPAKAESMAKGELSSRATAQTYAWYAYALLKNNKKDAAYKVFEHYVSGQPLEGLELYYMGKLMKAMNKGYNAQEFFKAANKNIYDLSPDMQHDLTSNLEE